MAGYAVEANVIECVVDQVLAQDATLLLIPGMADPNNAGYAKVYEGSIPQTTNFDPTLYPAVIYDWMASRDDTIAEGGYRVYTTTDYQFSAVGVGQGRAALAPIIQRIDAILQGLSLSTPAGFVGKCIRKSAFIPQVAPGDGKTFSRVGARYQFGIFANITPTTGGYVPPAGLPGLSFTSDAGTSVIGQTTFNLTHISLTGSETVYVGATVYVPGVDYTVATFAGQSVVVFATPLISAGVSILVKYAYASF